MVLKGRDDALFTIKADDPGAAVFTEPAVGSEAVDAIAGAAEALSEASVAVETAAVAAAAVTLSAAAAADAAAAYIGE